MSRKLWNFGDMKWTYIRDFYEQFCNTGRAEWRTDAKLTAAHVYLSPFLLMKVSFETFGFHSIIKWKIFREKYNYG